MAKFLRHLDRKSEHVSIFARSKENINEEDVHSFAKSVARTALHRREVRGSCAEMVQSTTLEILHFVLISNTVIRFVEIV